MMNLMHPLFNVCKYTGAKFWTKPCYAVFIERRWISKWAQSDAVATNKKADHVDDKFELIYRPPSASMLMVATSFCSISAFSCPLMLGQFAYDKFFDHNTELIEQIPTEQIVTMGVIGAASMVALTFCRTMPLRIYKHEKEYIAILPSLIPALKRKMEFKKGDVKEIKTTGWLKKLLGNFLTPGYELSSNYKVKNRKIFLSTKCFKTPSHLFEMFPNTAKYARKAKQLTKEEF